MPARRRPVRGNRDAAAVSAAEDDDDSGDVVKVDYRFSILAVRRFVDQLSEEQEEVLRSIGFEGVLHLTRYNKLDRHFSAWLCNQLEMATAAPLYLKYGAGEKVPVTARDVHEVLGVPSGERQVGLVRNPTEKESDAAAVRRALGLEKGEAPTLQRAQAVIDRRSKKAALSPPQGPMTQPERDAFVVAFLLLLVEHFFAPGPVGRRGKVNEEVFHAVANPSEVDLYDWAEYVLKEFRHCAASVRRQLTASRCAKISLSGCLLFLQIFYLDRLDLESTNCQVPRNVLPRVAAYDCNSLYNAIELDGQPEWREVGLKLFGKLKFAVKHAPQTDGFPSTSKGQPSLHSCDSEHHDSTKNTDMPSIVHDATEGTDTTNVHSYSANTAPSSRLQAEFRPKELLNNQQPVTQQGVPTKKRSRSKFCDVIKEASPSTVHQNKLTVSHDEAEKKPAGQMSSCQTTLDSSDDCAIIYSFPPKNSAPRTQSRSNPKCVFSNLHPRTKQEVTCEKICRTESEVREGTQCDNYQNKFAAASSCPEEKPVTQGNACQTTPEGDVMILDYNPFESDTSFTPSCNGPKMKKEYAFGRSPFEMGLVHPTPPSNEAEACFKWLEACSYQDDQLNWTWVILEEPNSIAVNGQPIKREMIRGGVLKQDVCNLVMRLYRQLDDEIYQNSGNSEPRWRHFLPAEWSSSALEHEDNICDESSPTVRSMFTGAHISYDVGLCMMVIVPVELDSSWSCYVWDFMEKRLNILDPLLHRSARNMEAIKKKHSSSAPQLLSALLGCLWFYCNLHGYDHQESSPNSWKTEILQDFDGMRSRRSNNTGMYTLFYAREFDGKDLRQTVSERTIVSFRKDLLHQMLTMRGNTGRRPLIVDYPDTRPT